MCSRNAACRMALSVLHIECVRKRELFQFAGDSLRLERIVYPLESDIYIGRRSCSPLGARTKEYGTRNRRMASEHAADELQLP